MSLCKTVRDLISSAINFRAFQCSITVPMHLFSTLEASISRRLHTSPSSWKIPAKAPRAPLVHDNDLRGISNGVLLLFSIAFEANLA